MSINVDTWPNAEINIQFAPWCWHWRPRAWLQEGAAGFAWLFVEVYVNWLPRRMR